MSIEQIVLEAAALPEKDRKQLIGRLIALGRNPEEERAFRQRMADAIDDRDPDHWVSYEELKKRLSSEPAAE